MKKRYLILSFLLSLVACTSPEQAEPTGSVTELYGKVYDVVATRVNAESSWYVVSGKSAMALEQGETEDSGVGLMSFFNYYEPQFCGLNQTCYCNGNLRFSFKMGSITSTDGPAEESDKHYNVFDPYEDPTKTADTNDTLEPVKEVAQVYLYEMQLKPETVQLSEYCREQVIRSVRIIRYQSGEIIVQDSYRDLLFRPRVSK